MDTLQQKPNKTKLDEAIATQVNRVITWFGRMQLGQDAISRAARAANLIYSHRIFAPRELHEPGQYLCEAALVQSEQDEDRFYAVCYKKGLNKWYCDCRDWRNGRARQIMPADNPMRPTTGAPHIPGQGIMCKHCLAVSIVMNVPGYKLHKK